MKKAIKITLITIALLLAAVLSVFFAFATMFSAHIAFGGYDYESDIECINDLNNNGSSLIDDKVDDVVFRYKTGGKELFLYNSADGEFFTSILDYKEKNGKTYYRNRITKTEPPITYHTEWEKVSDDFYYIYVDYEKDLEEIDCMGYEPVGTEIYYKLPYGRTERCYIYVIDKNAQQQK